MKGNFLARVSSFKKTKKGIRIKLILLMKERDRALIKPTHFMEEAGKDSQKKMDKIYIKEIENQIKRLKK